MFLLHRVAGALAAVALVLALPLPAGASGDEVVVVGAGDIAGCEWDGDEQTAALLDAVPGTVITFGDNAYPSGPGEEFRRCYEASWGRHKHRTRPSVGSHEYVRTGAARYFDYFGPAAGRRDGGYYSYSLGPYWHAVVLNSECAEVGGCGLRSPQFRWLATELARHPEKHILAYWHRPRFSSGLSGDQAGTQAFWDLLYASGAELILNGKEHAYERFARQDPRGGADPRGIRQFVVGTGGAPLYPRLHDRVLDRAAVLRRVIPGTARANSEVFNATTHGVLKLTLGRASYRWDFVPVAGSLFRDTGETDTLKRPASLRVESRLLHELHEPRVRATAPAASEPPQGEPPTGSRVDDVGHRLIVPEATIEPKRGAVLVPESRTTPWKEQVLEPDGPEPSARRVSPAQPAEAGRPPFEPVAGTRERATVARGPVAQR